MLCWEWNSLQSPRWLWLPADITHMIKFSCNNNACAQWQTCYYGSWTTLLNFRLLGAFSFTRNLLLRVFLIGLGALSVQDIAERKAELWALIAVSQIWYPGAPLLCAFVLFCCFVVCQLKMVIFFLFLLSLYRVFVLCVTQRDVQKGLARATTIFFLMVRFICKITVNCVDKCYRTTLFLKRFLCILCTFLVHTVMEKK